MSSPDLTVGGVELPLSTFRHFKGKGLGWTPDYPDLRDYTLDTGVVKEVLGPTLSAAPSLVATTTQIDLEPYFPPVEDQGPLGSCTAQAGVGLLEYYELRTPGRHVGASKPFLYKATRKILNWLGDTGAYLRTTVQAMTLLGIPPEQHYAYVISKFDLEPDPFVYALAQNWKALAYYRLDPAGSTGAAALGLLKQRLAVHQPAMFGFTVYSSLPTVTTTGIIPFPKPGDRVTGGHAVIAAGYDDTKIIDGVVGAIKIRNSWGAGWGARGYGWMPYQYFTSRLAQDIWSLVRAGYVDLAPFA